MRRGLLHCSWCGPQSLRPAATRRTSCECLVGRNGFDPYDFNAYVGCATCSNKYTVECLESMRSAIIDKQQSLSSSTTATLLDPNGLRRCFVEAPWRADSTYHGELFSKRTAVQAAQFAFCLHCEDFLLPAPGPRLADTFKEAEADVNPALTVVIEIEPVLPTGRGQPILLCPEGIDAWPLLAVHECKEALRGLSGSFEEYGGVLCLHCPCSVLSAVLCVVSVRGHRILIPDLHLRYYPYPTLSLQP